MCSVQAKSLYIRHLVFSIPNSQIGLQITIAILHAIF